MTGTALRTLFTFLFLIVCILSGHADTGVWEIMERDYQEARSALVAQSHPTSYCSTQMTSVLIFSGHPEMGVGLHEITDDALSNCRSAGIRFVRMTLYWGNIETSAAPGEYDHTQLQKWDETIRLCREHDIIPLVVVHTTPPGAGFVNRTESYNRFANFMTFVVERHPYVRYWELFNEMDVAFTDLFGAGISPDVPMRQRGIYYADMLKIVYPAIKRANPDAVVVHGGLTDFAEFPAGVYEGGGRDYFDVMNVHTYGVPLPWSFVLRGHELRAIMNQYGDEGKPLWNTEFGMDAAAQVRAWGLPQNEPGLSFDAMQTEALMGCLSFNAIAGLYQKCFVYQFFAPNEGVPDALRNAEDQLPSGMVLDDYGFGLFRSDRTTRRPSLQAIVDANINDPKELATPVTLEREQGDLRIGTDYPLVLKKRE